MIGRRRAFVVLLAFLLKDQWPQTLRAQLPFTETDNGSALHLTVLVQGPVSLKRLSWSGYAPVRSKNSIVLDPGAAGLHG
jgi:hypothetical protein